MSTTTKFTMHLIVPAKMVGTIVELMEGEGVLVSMEPYTEHKTGKSKTITRFRDDKTGEEIILRLLKDAGAKGLEQEKIQKHFVKSGRATTSHSSILSKLKSEQLVFRDNNLVWHLTADGVSRASGLKVAS